MANRLEEENLDPNAGTDNSVDVIKFINNERQHKNQRGALQGNILTKT